MTPVIEHLVACWRANLSNAQWLRSGVTAEQIDAFERRHGVILPAALRDLYSATDGNPAGEWFDDTMICFHPSAEVVSVRNDWPRLIRLTRVGQPLVRFRRLPDLIAPILDPP